jgi:hypothetical protein
VPPNETDKVKESGMWKKLVPDLQTQSTPPPEFVTPRLEQRAVERLVPRIGIPLEVKIYPRPGTIELGVLLLGSYALLRDYKPLRESIRLLEKDIREILDVPSDWTVSVDDIQTPNDSDARRLGGPVGLAMVSRYVWVILLILNLLALIFFCYLAFAAVIANT